MDIAAVEEQYLARARAQLGPRLEGIGLVLPDRSAAPPESDPALAGWWVDEAAAGERVVLPNPYETVQIVAAMEASVWKVVQRLAPALGERLDAVSRATAAASGVLVHGARAVAHPHRLCARRSPPVLPRGL